ncbi:hypothetical protein NX059_009595 [Plenodomus lindquistii]|nr:hypothetical protein NX059_009595 [Plenodomus lindquistii]
MAAYEPYSHSPQVGGRVSPRMYIGSPITPVHSPHHSITSSAASRTPVHHLTIHEYRRQQHTPALQEGATPGRKLRRKPAAVALNDVERAPLVANTTRSVSGSSLRPLHFSQSAHQLHTDRAADSHHALLETSFRSQSVGPHIQSGSVSSDGTVDSLSKVRIFKTRKRLPKPPVAAGFQLRSPPPTNPSIIERHPPQLQRSRLPGVLSVSSSEYARLSDAPTTPTTSSFSLSRFPQPPHLIDPSFSPPNNEGELSHVNALSYSSTAPATPPATPAIIHYRGASFDLVNPHESLLLHDIETPSRDFDSSDYLAVRTSEEFFEESGDMAPKRSLYGDLHAARAGIFQRLDDGAGNVARYDLPSPPTPTAVSPNSSAYTSPPYSPESVDKPSPLAIRKPSNDSRFSLKQLTRTLSRRVGSEPAKEVEEQELQPMSSAARPWQPTEYDYISTPQATYYPGHSSPMGPTSPQRERISYDAIYSPISPGELEYSPRQQQSRYSDKPLASLIPDDPSTQVGRMEASHPSIQDDTTSSRPYYDDLDSIYPSSSVYTGDDQRHSRYQPSLASNRQSKSQLRYSGMDSSIFANDCSRGSIGGFDDVHRQTYPAPGPITRDSSHQSLEQGNTKTDTISKLIDAYNPVEVASNPSASRLDQNAGSQSRSSTSDSQATMQLQSPRRPAVPSQFFDFRLHKNEVTYGSPSRPRMGSVQSRRPTINRDPGPPPRQALPLAPSFEYDEIPFLTPRAGASGIMSNKSSYSYGDTQNLLDMRQSELAPPKLPGLTLEPSSSYSQSEGVAPEPSSSYSQNEAQSPRTPQRALEEAEKIFEAAVEKKQEESKIPAMWARRNSGSQLLNQKMADRLSGISFEAPTNSARNSAMADWETIAGNSPEPEGRESLDSVADYSSSDDSGAIAEHVAQDPINSWSPIHEQRSQLDYSPMSPTRSQHLHNFASSPPRMMGASSPRAAPMSLSSLPVTSPTRSRTTSTLPFSRMPEEVLGRGAVEEPYAFAPWSAPYALSDRETEELLASGPNDDILVDAETPERTLHLDGQYEDPEVATTPSSVESQPPNPGLQRVNSFEKRVVVGPLGNLTGTPRGTRMSKTGSSIANTSSPGGDLSSMIARNSMRKERAEFTGFYASPSPAVSSVTRISPRRAPKPIDDRTPSEMTLFPRGNALEPVQESPSPPINERRRSMRNTTTFHTSRRISRSAVPGQTKLRHMLLAGEGRGNLSSIDTNGSRMMTASRPSTSDTTTPLYPTHLNLNAFAKRKVVAHEHSPHLLCPEREPRADDEALRRKLSWLILAMFCVLPPCIILYRWMGDRVIVSMTKGRLGHTSARSKRVALIAGITVNVGLVTAILVPIFVAHAMKVV